MKKYPWTKEYSGMKQKSYAEILQEFMSKDPISCFEDEQIKMQNDSECLALIKKYKIIPLAKSVKVW